MLKESIEARPKEQPIDTIPELRESPAPNLDPTIASSQSFRKSPLFQVLIAASTCFLCASDYSFLGRPRIVGLVNILS